MNDTVPWSMMPTRTAPNAELIQRVMAADDLGPHAIGAHADVIRGRADEAQAELDERKANGRA